MNKLRRLPQFLNLNLNLTPALDLSSQDQFATGRARLRGKSKSTKTMMPRPARFIPPLGPPKSSARQRALAALHGIDLLPFEEARRRSEKSVSEVLPNVLTRLRMDKRQSETEIVRVWNGVLDPNLTAHAQPAGINKGTLFVNVDSSVWLSEIVRYRRKEILDRLQHSFGRELIQKISFRIG
jgi:Dna[CI] antecedent, DciA